MGVATRAEFVSSTTMKFPTAAMRQTAGDWAFSQDIPSDVSVVVGSTAYALHKFPLVSRSGWMRRIISDSNLSKIELPDLPGGADTFELAAKFCYGINFEIDAKNVAALRCAAEYLDMSEAYAEENLSARTDAYLDEVVVHSLPTCVAVLQSCETLLPLAEELGIVNKCVDAAASRACKEQMTPSLSRSDLSSSGRMEAVLGSPGNFSQTPKRRTVEWWVEEISVLHIDTYKKVILAMKARGMRSDSLGSAISFYAQKWLRGLLKKQAGQLVEMRSRAKQMKAAHDLGGVTEQEQQRGLVETLVSLLPCDRGVCSVSFVFAMLKVACYLEVSSACKAEIEKRIGWQLEQAAVDDLLIPSFSQLSDSYFDLDCVSRIVGHFLQQEGGHGADEDTNHGEDVLATYDYSSAGGGSPPPQSAVMKAARVLDSFLAEVAPDANLSVSKFVAFAELMPSYARVVDDGLYRAVDIYLKAHPGVSEMERKKVASLMDCQKLSQEACTHAAQNERLPVQVVVQVLYFEQMRLKNAMSGSSNLEEELSHLGSGLSQYAGSGALSMGVMSPAAAKTNSEQLAQKRLMGSGRPPAEQTPRTRARQLQMSGNFEETELPPAYQVLAAGAPKQAVDPYQRSQTQQGVYDEHGRVGMDGGTGTGEAGYVKQDVDRPRVGFFQNLTMALSRLNPFQRLSSSNDTGLRPPNTPDARARRRRHSIS